MTILTISMNARPEKRRELLQALQGLGDLLPQENGFRNLRLQHDPDNKNFITFIEEWENPEALETYINSEYFEILCGAMSLLTEDSKVFAGLRPSDPREMDCQEATPLFTFGNSIR